MVKQFLITLSLVLTLSSAAYSQHQNKVVKDSRLNRDVLVGICNNKGLQGPLFGTYFNQQYNNYKPDQKKIDLLKQNLNKTRITIVFGSWCGDSKMQVGRFYKILDETGFNHTRLTTIAVDRSIHAGTMNIKNLNIHRIPTFIVYYKGKEMGRIIESPNTSLENDLWEIVRKIK